MIDDIKLRKVLERKIEQIKEFPRSWQKKVEMEMATRYNVKFGDVIDIFNGISPYTIEELDYNMLYKLMKSIYSVTLDSTPVLDSSDLDEKVYFTKHEILEFNQPYPKEDKDYDLVITDWKQISATKYKIFTNIDEVIRWRNLNKLNFNPETQRDLIVTIVNGKKVNRLDINRTAIKEMKSLMLKGMYFNVTGTININPDLFPESLPYKDGKNLIIPKEAHMDLIEGFHNYLAETEVKDSNPDWEYDIEFDLRLMNVDDCNRFITQMNKKNHFKPSQIVRIDSLSEINYIISQLNTRSSFHLYGTINNEIKVYLNKVITNLYGTITDRSESIKLLQEIENNINYAIEKTNHFNNPLSTKEWLLYININKYANSNSIKFSNIIDNVDIESIIKSINFKEPNPKNIRSLTQHITEVINNAL